MLRCSKKIAATRFPIHFNHKELMMSYLTAEQMLAAQKANLETLFGLTEKAYAGVEKLVELNMQLAKTSLAEVAETTQAAMSVKDAQELLALQQSMLQPAAEKAAAYSRQVYEIAAGTNAEVSKVVEGQMADSQKKFMAMVDGAIKNAPAGTESAASLVKSAIAAANNAMESVQKAAKQATDVAEANFQAMTSSAVKASAAPAKGRRATA
jgi:phasin family protein